MKLTTVVAVVLLSCLAGAQNVHVTSGKGSVSLSVSAIKPYQILASESKRPVLSVQCTQKGKKVMHVITFTAGGALGEDDPESTPKNGEITLNAVVGGKQLATSWIPFTDPITFAYYGRTEPERLEFLQKMFSAPTLSVEFTPFLTGNIITTVFDISKLQEEMNNHPECATK